MSLSESYYLCRWGANLDNRGNKEKNQPWVNVGQGIYSVAVGEKHAVILNSNKNVIQIKMSVMDAAVINTDKLRSTNHRRRGRCTSQHSRI